MFKVDTTHVSFRFLASKTKIYCFIRNMLYLKEKCWVRLFGTEPEPEIGNPLAAVATGNILQKVFNY